MQQEPKRRKLSDLMNDLTGIVSDALDSANLAPHLPVTAIEHGAKAIADALGALDRLPNADEVTKIVAGALEIAGEGAGAAAEAAADVAGAILEGIGDVDLNI
jgi:hypothetical protein